ncbi:hypothetical protein MWH28_02985 [Natroniella sulfidigena]|uniref:hypothetical protein n=1 Tax=Natroniella sulfidigena TaxID=723921 RepID=UPI00200AA8C8|nr:hypothetical protein [Natroniella sulfidigena]MCK8816328.1 hypothetical protein [Natroniella sulfidigena]
MKKKLVIVLIFSFLLSGCLVYDRSEFELSREEEEQVRQDAHEATVDFFEYNEYPGFDEDKLIDLLSGDGSLTIDPMRGSRYSKGFNELRSELRDHFFVTDEDNNSNLKEGYSLTFRYGDYNFRDEEMTHSSVSYIVWFKVFETIDDQERWILTDNGYIDFDLTREGDNWLIDDLEINFQRLGVVEIEAVENDGTS